MRAKTMMRVLAAAVMIILAACSGGGSESARTVEAYLKALAEKNGAQLAALSCAAWEEDAMLELDSFQAVSTELKDLACAESGSEDGDTLVTCTGSLLATYNNEQQELDLSLHIYRVVTEGGEQRVCGYQ